MGRRRISWEPAARTFSSFGLIVMKVWLCGPHSFDTSTLPLTVVEVVLSGLVSPPLSRMNSYLLHQVGSCELFSACTPAGRLEIQRLNDTNAKRPTIAK